MSWRRARTRLSRGHERHFADESAEPAFPAMDHLQAAPAVLNVSKASYRLNDFVEGWQSCPTAIARSMWSERLREVDVHALIVESRPNKREVPLFDLRAEASEGKVDGKANVSEGTRGLFLESVSRDPTSYDATTRFRFAFCKVRASQRIW